MTGAAVAGLGLIAACAAIARLSNLVESAAAFLVWFSVAFLCYALASWRLAAARGPRALALVIVVGVIARLTLVSAAPTLSTDAYRYVWDARVAHAGISPYAFAPADRELERLRDAEIFPRLNHPTWRTLYPPATQAFFQTVYRLKPDSVLAMKLAVALLELVGVATVLGLLRAAGRPLSHAVIYVWNPLVLVEVWGTGHIDGILVPLVAGAMWAIVRSRYAAAGALLGVGTLFKLYPAALLGLLPVAAWPAAAASLAGVVLLGYAPGLVTGTAVLGSLPRYLTEEYFNPGLVRSVVDVPIVTAAAAAAWLTALAVVRRPTPLGERAVLLVGGLLVLAPNIFPWYAVSLATVLAWAPSLPWIAFTGTVMFAYTFFLQDPWQIPGWARTVEFTPLALAAGWWLVTRLSTPGWRERAT